MKKRIFAVLMTLLCVSLVFALASCGDTPDEPTECTEHTFGEWETETYASCTQDGLRVRECTVCGFEEEEEIEGGHKWDDWQTVTELTCTQHGLKTRVCRVCTFEERDEKEAQGHVWGTEPSKTIQEGDCTTDGIYEYKCDNCEETKEETVEAVGHDWSEWGKDLVGDPFVKEATCQEAGYIGRECIECGEPEYEYTDKLPHEWEDWVVVGTCAEGATRTRGCVNCDAEEEETSAPGEHANVVYEGAKAPTLEEDGSTGVKKCLACGEVLAPAKVVRIMNYALTAAPSTSSWAVVAKYMNDGDMTTGVTGYGNAVRNTIHTLTWTKAVGVEEITLYFSGDATGKNIGGNLSGQLANTNPNTTLTVIIYDENDEEISRFGIPTKDATEYTITLEEQVQISKIDIINANEWDTSKCVNIWEVEVIGTAYLSECDLAGSHSWGDWETVNAPVCNEDGTLTNGLDTRTCSVCGDVEEKVIEATHSFGAWDETGVNCETGGTRTKECTVCGYVVSETVAAGEHVEIERQGAKEPTFEEDGSTGALVCTKCGTTIEEAKVISKYVNSAKDATATDSAWIVTPGYLIDGNMNTGVTGYGDAKRDTTHTLTWTNAVSVNVIKLYFNGATTDKNLGGNIPESYKEGLYNNTNVAATLTITVYGADGTTVVKTESINTSNLTEYTITFEQSTQIAKIEIVNTHNWSVGQCVNIWELEAISGGQIVENKAE